MSGNDVTNPPVYLRIETAYEADVLERMLEVFGGRVAFESIVGRSFSGAEDAAIIRLLDRLVRTRAGMEPDPKRTIIRHVTIVDGEDV